MTDVPTLLRHGVEPEFSAVYETMRIWKERSLIEGRSLLEPDTVVWTTELADELHRRIALEPDLTKDTFVAKLRGQMAGGSQELHLLLADLLVIHLLATRQVSLDKKLEIVSAVGSMAPQPFQVPAILHAALRKGPVNPGIGFNTNRFWIVSFLISFAVRWSSLDPEQRSRLLSDPWAMKTFVADTPGERAQSQRNALLFLLFPETFEDITSDDHKRRIVEAHTELAGDDPDLDRQLLAARTALSERYGSDFNWYRDDVRPMWDRKATTPPAISAEEPSAEEAFRHHFPDDDTMMLFAETMVHAIRAAHDVNPAGWSLNRRSDGAALTAGPNHALAVRNGEVTIIALGDVEEFRSETSLGSVKAEAYSAPPGALWVNFSADRLDVLLDRIGDSFLEAVRGSAYSRAAVRRYFSEELIEVLEHITGETLPRPHLADTASGEHAWVVRMKRDGVREVPAALARGDIRIFWDIEVAPGGSLQSIRDALTEADPDLGPHRLGNHAGQIHRFVSKMSVGDYVLAPDGADVYIGEVASPARFESGEWVRDVQWANADEPIGRSEISEALYSRLRSLLTVTEISDLRDELAVLIGAAEGKTDAPIVAVERADVALRKVDSDLARELHLDRDWLQEVVDLLQRRRQVIFFGPPGTGKTYLAERIAEHLVEEPSDYRIVQFHPSYSYEDFVEGFRPVVDAKGQMSYELKPGPLKQLAAEARANPGEPYLLIIDEINRGNLAKIFGELCYLLEYRERSIVLQYGTGTDDEFSLPRNLFLIGTMNTADRSIALVDAAIRRRFGFVEFSPLEAPVGEMLRTWLARQERDDLPARLLDELNPRLGDRDLAVGPSYLMKPDSVDVDGLERIWRFEIMPLLTEQFFGRPEVAKQFNLQALLAAVSAVSSPVSGDDGADSD